MALSKALDNSGDSDTICLARAAQIVCHDLFDLLFTFEGSFELNCQEKSVPTTLITLINMLLEGPNIVKQTDRPVRSEAFTVAQLIRHNSVKHRLNCHPLLHVMVTTRTCHCHFMLE